MTPLYEYETFPVCSHDDMLDGQARILDPELKAEFPGKPKKRPRPRIGRNSLKRA